ncbi:peroxiredoxin family protein [Arsenicibacter rosenii]|uniref:Alkyl hydroperoxide reductase subunit C/ Thiol specific antioxidant domain-containing protein n=1 Tax=Arsenicibacter rosenii TaxID=1750698 RepID=A0A1S2VJL7_9BACT|nr:redoxin domain-containing protein [Arsenicibacter rosenii]OIN58018.1 hypothetical protein BLX24_15900 [Arsenicibacter rosenii]
MLYEIENEAEEIHTIMLRDRTATQKIKPLVTGEKIPYINLVSRSDDRDTAMNNVGVPGFATSLDDLIEAQPLVIAFYSTGWGRFARPYLDALVRLSLGLKAIDTRLLVIAQDPVRSVSRQVGESRFLVAQDTRFSVARRFGIYSEDDPVWDRISGISDDVFIPAVYVVNQERTITYHAIDEYFEHPLDLERIIDAVLELSPVV